MVVEHLSRLQCCLLAWVLVALGLDKGNVSTSVKGLEREGLVMIVGTPGGKAEVVELTPDRRSPQN